MKILHNIKVKMCALLLFAAAPFTPPTMAQQGYAVFDEATGTLTFKYGTPTGTVDVDYYETDDTSYGGNANVGWKKHASECTQVIFEPSFKNARPVSCQGWFSSFKKIASFQGLEYLNTEEVVYFGSMFYNCSSLVSLDLSHFNTENAIEFASMFYGCSNLTELDLTNFKTPKAQTTSFMFCACGKLKTLLIPNFDTSNVRFFSNMFRSLAELEELDIAHFDFSSCTDINYMFEGCAKLKRIDVSNLSTAKVMNFTGVFANCSSLTSLTFGPNFSLEKNYDNYGSTSAPFEKCTQLRYIDFRASNHTNAITAVDRGTYAANIFKKLPRTTVIYLPHGSQDVTDAENVVYSYNGDANDLRCPKYYSEDKVDIEFPYDFITNEAEYKRTMSTECGSVILPYAFTSNSNVRAYTLEKEYDNDMWFVSTETVPAHTPFVFKKLRGSQGNFTQRDTSKNFGITIYATRDTEEDPAGPYTASANLGGWTMKGYYVNQTLDSYSDLYYIRGDKFVRANGESLQFPPHRVTFHGSWAISPSGSPAGAPSYEIKFKENSTTGIDKIDAEESNVETQAVYDITGRQIPTAKRGVNIVRMKDGSTRKVIIK